MPFNLAPEKILVLLVFALVFLGPDKLPEAARKIGEVVGHARRLSGGLQGELRQAIDEPLKTFTREFTAGEQKAITAADATGSTPADPEGTPAGAIVAADAVAPDAVPAPAAVDTIEPGIEPSVPIATSPLAPASPLDPAPAAADETVATTPPAAKPALPSWVFPGGSRANGPGFH